MFKFPRLFIIYAIAAPLALIPGYLVSSPESNLTFEAIGSLLLFFALPIFLKWHHVLMILFWNSAFIIPFLIGGPHPLDHGALKRSATFVVCCHF